MGQLGDFDSMEYAQALVPRLAELEQAGITLQAIAIGDEAEPSALRLHRHNRRCCWSLERICTRDWGFMPG